MVVREAERYGPKSRRSMEILKYEVSNNTRADIAWI